MQKAVLLLSSGLDSAANLVLQRSPFTVGYALTIDYGQKSAEKEIAHAALLAAHFKVPHKVLHFQSFTQDLVGKSSSALLSGNDIPGKDYFVREGDLDEKSIATQTAKAVWVPNRNGVFISLAAAFAEALGFDAVAVGFNAEEAVTFPDNSVEFMKAQSQALHYSTANQISVVSHTSDLHKTEIVQLLMEKEFPFSLLWSCYHDGAKHCGNCESCLRLKRALSSGLSHQEFQEKIQNKFDLFL